MTAIKTRSIFLDGRIVKARDGLIDSLAPGVVCGRGVFETMRVYNGAIFVLERHIQRLFRGLRLLKIRLPYSKKLLEQHLYKTIKANSLGEARIRLAVWKEEKHLRVAIVCQDITSNWDQKYHKGLNVIISSIKRKKTRFSNIKSLDYLCFRKASKEAKELGCDEAILLNNRKEIVEGSRTNIFIANKGILYTPAIKCGCLNGITRQLVMQYARTLGITCRASTLNVRDVLRADEVFVTNSLVGIMPVSTLDGHSIGQKRPGPLTKRLMKTYHTNVHLSCPA